MRNILLLSVITTISVISIATMDDAFAHSTYSQTVTMSNDESRTFQLVVGHTDEPTFGVDAVHEGKHHVDIRIRDKETKLVMPGAKLTLDKYYFASTNQVGNATSPSQAPRSETNIPVSSVFGTPGSYIVRQLVQPGIYGYHIYGTVKYFDNVEYPVDFTVFCSDGAKFNSPGITGSFGCVDNIKDIKFPKK